MTETLTCTWATITTTTKMLPAGSDDLAKATLNSDSRSLTNDQRQVYEEDDYTNSRT